MLRVVGLLLALGVLASAAPLGTSPRPRLLHRFAERNLMRATAQTRRHNGVFVNGPHQNIANDCSDAIAAALSPGSAFNTYVSGYKILAGTDEVWTSKHVMAFAGTAAEVMGCRAAPGNDLDFWSTAANIRRLGTVLYRFELAAAKDNIWVAREGINPGEPADATHLGTFLNYREMDVWSIKANRMSQDVYGRIRDRIHKGGNVDSMLLDVHGNKIRVMDCANQIRAKWSLVTDGHRHAKHVTGHPNDHTPGRRKLTNDALDLQCLCHHKKCKNAVQSLDHENDDVKQICDYDWQAVSTAAADPTWTQANYNQLAGTLAANGYKSIHTRPNAPQALRTAMAGVEALKVK